MASERALQLAGQIWCKETMSNKEMDATIAIAVAELIDILLKEPHLECATRTELTNELATRMIFDDKRKLTEVVDNVITANI